MNLRATIIPLAIVSVALILFPIPAVALRVCADPDYLPYSNRAGQGFENRIAQAVGKMLGEPVQYTWASYRGHGGFTQFLASTIDAKKCDVVMSIPYGSRDELTTRPYYISSYVFVFAKTKNYNITSIDSPALKKLKIGFERDTPAEEALKLRGMISQGVPFDVGDSTEQSPAVMVYVRSGPEPVLLRKWESRDLESHATARRQQMVHYAFRAQSGHRSGCVGVSDDSSRCLGL